MKKILIVGGNIATGRGSSIITKLALEFDTYTPYNGILPGSISGKNLVMWFPDIPNGLPKDNPIKDKGAVMIISKVMREDTTRSAAVSKIFSFGANAVVCIHKEEVRRSKFVLIDALNNVRAETYSVKELAIAIRKFYRWSKAQIRMGYKHEPINVSIIDKGKIKFEKRFITINKDLADKLENSRGQRYFGNISTRCMSPFPTARRKWEGDSFLFSPRNSDKRRLTEEDCVLIIPPNYYGNRKYSVEAPIQIAIYGQFSDINYMIHGHARAAGALVTGQYRACGDLREVYDVVPLLKEGHKVINLLNHGFLLVSKTLGEMEDLTNMIKFER